MGIGTGLTNEGVESMSSKDPDGSTALQRDLLPWPVNLDSHKCSSLVVLIKYCICPQATDAVQASECHT
jgi:hypothetical protein